MQLEPQAMVRTEDGTQVGKLDRVVVNPDTREVTHLVVKKGILAEDKVVPVGLVGAGTDEGVTLRGDETDLERLPPFEEKHYVQTTDQPPAGGSGPIAPMNLFPGAGFGTPVVSLDPVAPEGQGVHMEVTRNIPEGTVALKASANVVAADGRSVGRVEQVLTHPGTDRVTELVIARGFLGKSRRRIPMSWIRQMREAEVDLQVESATVEEARVVAR